MEDNQEIFKNKHKIKGDIKFSIYLNDEQREAKRIILENTVTVIKGNAGSGKSAVAVATALDLLFKKEIEKIIITRPAIASFEDIGYLPGSKDEKLQPYLAPLYDIMNKVYKKEIIEKHLAEGNIEVIPLGFMRGRNFSNCLVIVDEGQNVQDKQMQLLLGRLCKGSKMVICGDSSQIDLKDKKLSGFDFICKNMKDINGFEVVTLKVNHRAPIVEEILKIYKEVE
jgi:phosphate starvation-inducible PhoH-like protein